MVLVEERIGRTGLKGCVVKGEGLVAVVTKRRGRGGD